MAASPARYPGRFQIMKIGQVIDFVRDNSDPLKSTNTRLVNCAFSCGIKPLESGAYSQTVQQTDNGPKRTVTWAIDGASKAVFEPIAEREEISFVEFRKRFESLDWCEANPNHPISYLRAFCDNENRLLDFIKAQKPQILVQRGNRTVVLPADCKPEVKSKLLGML
jgi:hypothetical protein